MNAQKKLAAELEALLFQEKDNMKDNTYLELVKFTQAMHKTHVAPLSATECVPVESVKVTLQVPHIYVDNELLFCTIEKVNVTLTSIMGLDEDDDNIVLKFCKHGDTYYISNEWDDEIKPLIGVRFNLEASRTNNISDSSVLKVLSQSYKTVIHYLNGRRRNVGAGLFAQVVDTWE